MGHFQPGHPRVGGRKKGDPNKTTQDIRNLMASIHEEHGGAEVMFRDLYKEADVSQRVDLLKLSYAYRFGKPKETHEVVGEGGGPVRVKVEIVKRSV